MYNRHHSLLRCGAAGIDRESVKSFAAYNCEALVAGKTKVVAGLKRKGSGGVSNFICGHVVARAPPAAEAGARVRSS